LKTRKPTIVFLLVFGAFLFSAGCAQFNASAGVLGLLLVNQPASSSATPAVTVTESGSSTVVSEASGYDFYTVSLTAAPQSDVTISIAFDATQLKINGQTTSPQLLTFTPSNWSNAQTVIVRAVDDTTAEGILTYTLTQTATSSDSRYNGISVASVSVRVIDNDSSGVLINESGGSTDITEGSGNDSYTVTLSKAPSNTVNVSIAFDASQVHINGSGVSPVVMTFTTGNWFTPQTVTVTGQNDGLVEGPHTSSISHTSTSADASYNAIFVPSVQVGITDINGPGVSIVESAGSSSVTEGGATDSYTVVLTSAPSSTVTVSLGFNSSLLVLNGSGSSPVQLTFNSGNWSAPQTVNIAAFDDSIIQGTHSGTITHTVTSSDSSYNAMSVRSVTVSITDDDITPLVAGGVQTGLVTITNVGDNPNIVTLATPVDITKSFVMCYFTTGSSGINHVPTCQITASNQITIRTGLGDGSAVTIRYYLLEFASGAVVQRGSFNMGAGTSFTDVPVTAVDLSKSFLIAYARTTGVGSNNDEERLIRAQFTSTTNARFTRGETGVALDIEWQAIQLDGAQVQSGTISLPNGTASAIAPLGVFDQNSAFLIHNYSAGNLGGVEADYLTAGAISSSTSLTFSRQTTNQQIDVSYFLVEMINGPKIQHGTININTVSTSGTATLSPAVNVSFTMPIINFNLSDPDPASLDSGFFRPEVLNTTTIYVERFNTEAKSCVVPWFTIELTSQ